MVQPYKLSNDPVEDRNYKRRILQIWIDSISKMCSVPLVSDIVDNSQRTRYVKTDRIGLSCCGNVTQNLDDFFSIKVCAQRSEFPCGPLLEHTKCGLAEATTLDCAQPKTAKVIVSLRLDVGLDELTHKFLVIEFRQA